MIVPIRFVLVLLSYAKGEADKSLMSFNNLRARLF